MTRSGRCRGSSTGCGDPSSCPPALLGAMRVLTDPAETGAVTIALPQDVQAEADDWPEELFARRVWHVRRPVPEPAALARAVAVMRSARRPLIVAGGGVIYSEATEALRRVRRGHRHPGRRHAGRQGRDPLGPPAGRRRRRVHRLAGGERARPRGRRGARGRHPLQRLHHRVAHGVPEPGRPVRQPQRHAAGRSQALRGDAAGRRPGPGWRALTEALDGYRVESVHQRHRSRFDEWNRVVDEAYHLGPPAAARRRPRYSARSTRPIGPDATVVQAAGSMPGDLQMLWRAQDPKQYHVEYAFSCMGYEIAGALGIKMAAPEREVYSLVGDGSYLMMAPGDRHGGLGGHQADHRDRAEPRVLLDRLPVGVARVAAVRHLLPVPQPRDRHCSAATSCRSTWPPTPRASGADVIRVQDASTSSATRSPPARAATRTTAIHIETDPLAPVPSPRAGGTCRSPRSRSWTARSRRARPTRRTRPSSGLT